MKFRKQHIVIVLIAAFALYLVIGGVYNFLISEEQKIKNLFYEMAEDIEERDVLGFADYFTETGGVTYRDNRIDRNLIVPFLIKVLRPLGDLKISLGELTVEVKGEHATVTFSGYVDDLQTRSRGFFEGSSQLRKVEGEWKLQSATAGQQRRPRGF